MQVSNAAQQVGAQSKNDTLNTRALGGKKVANAYTLLLVKKKRKAAF